MSERNEGIDRYTTDQPEGKPSSCPECGGKRFVESKTLIKSRVKPIWTCLNCGACFKRQY